MRKIILTVTIIAAMALIYACDMSAFMKKSGDKKQPEKNAVIGTVDKNIDENAPSIINKLEAQNKTLDKIDKNVEKMSDNLSKRMVAAENNIKEAVNSANKTTTSELSEKISKVSASVEELKSSDKQLMTVMGAGFGIMLLAMLILFYMMKRNLTAAKSQTSASPETSNTDEALSELPEKYADAVKLIQSKEEELENLLSSYENTATEDEITVKPEKKQKDTVKAILNAINAQEALGLGSNSKKTFFSALDNMYEKNYDKALEDASRLLESGNEDIAGYSIKGFIHYINKQYEKAEEAFTEVTNITPNSHFAYSNLALTLLKLKKMDAAADAFRKSLVISPKDFATWNRLASVLNMSGKIDEAIKAYNRAVEINPEYHEAYHNLATLYFQQKQYEIAIENYDKALAVKDNKVESIYNKACAYALMGSKKEAMEALKNAIEIDVDYKAKAAKDDDFKSLQSDEEFKTLVA